MHGTVFEIFAETAKAAADHPFLIVPARADRDWHPGGVAYSYGQTLARGGAPARSLCGSGLRPRAPRLDPAGEPAGILLPLPRAECDRRLHRAHQPGLPPRRGRLSARPQRGRAGRGAAASRGRCDEGGGRAGQAAAGGGCACDAGPSCRDLPGRRRARTRRTSRRNARCSTRPAPPGGPRAACCPTSTR